MKEKNRNGCILKTNRIEEMKKSVIKKEIKTKTKIEELNKVKNRSTRKEKFGAKKYIVEGILSEGVMEVLKTKLHMQDYKRTNDDTISMSNVWV